MTEIESKMTPAEKARYNQLLLHKEYRTITADQLEELDCLEKGKMHPEDRMKYKRLMMRKGSGTITKKELKELKTLEKIAKEKNQ
jgi:hypothetical protein